MNLWLLRRRIHSSHQIAIFCYCLFVGVFAAQYIRLPSGFVNALIIASILIFIVCLWRKYLFLMILVAASGFMVGWYRGCMTQANLSVYGPLVNKTLTLEGQVSDDVDIDSSNQLIIKLKKISLNGHGIDGGIWLTASSKVADIKRSDIVKVKGLLKNGFGSFAGAMYRAEIIEVTHRDFGDLAREARDWFSGSIKRAIGEPEASLGIGFLVGQRQALSADLTLALQIVGLTHIVVASGYNLTILVRLARRIFAPVSKYLSAVAAVGMIISFIAITGFSPSMVRAGLVSGLSLLAWYYGRKFHPITLLALAVAITVAINPSYAWGDLGWQLSFAAFAGVMILAPLLQHYFFGETKPNFIMQILIETIAAHITTAPIIIVSFGQFSNVAIVANLLVLPMVPLAMLLTFVAGVGGLAIPLMANLIALPAKWLIGYIIFVVNNLASISWASVEISMPWLVFGLYYLAVLASCLYMWRVTGYNLREVNLVE